MFPPLQIHSLWKHPKTGTTSVLAKKTEAIWVSADLTKPRTIPKHQQYAYLH